MPQTITRGIDTLMQEANAIVPTLSIAQARELIDSPAHVFVDLRDIREVQRSGRIPGAFSCPRGMLEFWIDPASPYHKDIFARDSSFVFYCASAWRSALAGRAAIEMGLTPVMHLAGGFSAWSGAGAPIEQLKPKD